MNIDRASAVDDLPISPLTLEESSNDITSPSTVPSSNGSVPSGSHAEDVVENVKEDVVKDLSSVGGDDVLGENLERDGEVPVSPSSSGCDDARDEIEDVDTDSNHGAMTVNSAADGAPWVPGKRYHDEVCMVLWFWHTILPSLSFVICSLCSIKYLKMCYLTVMFVIIPNGNFSNNGPIKFLERM